VRDGNISDSEYGNSLAGNQNTNKFTSSNNGGGGGTWYMTWDANNLYVAKTGGSDGEPTTVYLDLDPTLPVTGGGSNLGNLDGVNQNDVTAALPFRADARIVVTGGNNNRSISVFRRDGLGGWVQTPTQTGLNYGGNGTNREFSVSWNALTGGGTIPASFNWLGFCDNTQSGNGNYRYDQAPTNFSSFGNNNNTPPFEYYYTVANTASGSATKPFILRSYTFPRTGDNNSFGAIDVWDFTMNSPGRQISRSTNGGSGDWTISGSLVVGSGILYFGSGQGSYGNSNVGNVRVLDRGVLYMDATTKPLLVREDVDLRGGGQLRLSGLQGGDLFVGRDFIVTDGVSGSSVNPATFQPLQRQVTFSGAGVPHTIKTNNSNYQIPFDFLELNSTGAVTLGDNTNIFVGNRIAFTQGLLYTNNNAIELAGAASLNTETEASHIVGNVFITQNLGSTQSGTKNFGNIGLTLTPQGTSGARGEVTVLRVTGDALYGVGGGNGGASIQRYFLLTSNAPSVSNLNLNLVYAYRTDELNNILENNLALYQSTTGTPGSFTKLTTPPTANTSTHTLTFDYQMPLASGTYLALGDGVLPLPVKLVAFRAKATAEGAALLRWNTASEHGSKGFAIERQLGQGEPWKQVGFVSSTNAAMGSNYEYLDNSLAVALATPQAYYRLRQEDFTGTVAYSPVEVIARTAGANTTELVLSPVPVSGSSVSLTFAEAGQAGSQITVSNTQGQRMLHFTTEASSEVSLSVPVEKLVPGVYILSVQAVGQSPRYTRFVKL
jgi:hypothetical protein